MSSEWMKVMLDEIARKKSEANEARAELERRGGQAPAHAAPDKSTRGKSSGGRPPQ